MYGSVEIVNIVTAKPLLRNGIISRVRRPVESSATLEVEAHVGAKEDARRFVRTAWHNDGAAVGVRCVASVYCGLDRGRGKRFVVSNRTVFNDRADRSRERWREASG